MGVWEPCVGGAVARHVSVHCGFSAPLPCQAQPGAWLPDRSWAPRHGKSAGRTCQGGQWRERPAAATSGPHVRSGWALPPSGPPWRPDHRPCYRAISQLTWDHPVEAECGF